MSLPQPSRLAGIKEYVSPREVRSRWAAMTASDQDSPTRGRSTIYSWSKWAGQKIRRNTTDVTTVNEAHLFPGWATKQPRPSHPGEPEAAFDLVFHVSGFATSRRTPELLTRSQRAFLRLARSFASISKPQSMLNSPDTEPLDFPEHLNLPPRPDEISNDYEVRNLDVYFQNSGNQCEEMDDIHRTSHFPHLPVDDTPVELARLNDNLESRLKLFWASSLSSRRIQVSVFLHPPDSEHHRHSLDFPPLLIQEMLTETDGHFSGTFKIDWHDISTHPVGTSIISNQTCLEHELFVEARVINTERTPVFRETPKNTMHIPITHAIVRVISDIDDTVKVSRIVDGARAIFHQVFVKDLEDTVIPGMGEWYDTLWNRGARFHYVSNGPYEYLPVINDFISIAKLPVGSVRLRSYTGRSLFNGLLSSPAVRKKGNIVEILDQFPASQFLLVGDSGEQDLELYASLAAERPDQIAGVFIRDVSGVGLEDPTGLKADFGLTSSPMKLRTMAALPFASPSIPSRIVPKRAASDTDISSPLSGTIYIPRPTKKASLPPASFPLATPPNKLSSRVSQDSSSSIHSTGSSPSSSVLSMRPMRPVTEEERKRCDLQSRVNRARLQIPSHIAFRVFEDPKECVEAEQIIHRLMSAN